MFAVHHHPSPKSRKKINATLTLRDRNKTQSQSPTQAQQTHNSKYNIQPSYIAPSSLSPVKKQTLTQSPITSSCPSKSPKSNQHHHDINNYRLTDCIGRGNFGDVYKAFDLKNQINVAIKAINVEQSDDDIPILLQEINLLRSLRHPNITNWYKTFVIDVTMFIVMEYCGEGSCADLLKFNKSGLDESILSYIMKNVLQGLKYLHDLNIIHRDIKAANILITSNHIIKLADFGVSGQMNGLTGKKTFVGTPYWMAPEIITEVKSLKNDRENMDKRLLENGLGRRTLYKLWRKKITQEQIDLELKERRRLEGFQRETEEGSKESKEEKTTLDRNIEEMDDVEYDEKVDIWSLGITLIELATGKVPNSDKEPLKVLFEISKMEPPRLPESSGYYIKEFTVACLSKDPVLRPSADELLKFKFITKNKLRYNALSVLSGHSSKMKKRRPKYELNLENINFGPEVNWDLKVDIMRELPKKEVFQIDDNEDRSSSVYEDDTFANSYFGNPLARDTADTSPLVGANHHNSRIDGAEEYTYNSCSVRELDSDKIRDIIEQAGLRLHIGNDTNLVNKSIVKKTLGCLNRLEEALVELRHCDAEMAGEVCRRLGDVSGW